MPTAQSTRRRAGPTRAAKSSVKASATSPDELADQLASRLTISASKDVKGKHKASVSTLEDDKLAAMQLVNGASQYLSAAVQVGWKPSSATKSRTGTKTASGSWSVSSITKTVQTTRGALQRLRELNSEDLDVERASSTVIGKLVLLELYAIAEELLSDMRPRLVSHCLSLTSPDPSGEAANNNTDLPAEFRLLCLPLPSSPFIDPDLLTLISTYLLHSLTTTCYTIFQSDSSPNLEALPEILFDNSSFLNWIPRISQLSAKHLNSIYTRAYTAVVKSSTLCSGHPVTVLRVRVYGLLCLLHTAPGTVERNTLWDQATKFFTAFAKSVYGTSKKAQPKQDQYEAAALVCSSLSLLVSISENRGNGSSWLTGRGFVECGEYCMNIATRTGSLELVEKISRIIQASPSTSSSSPSQKELKPPASGQLGFQEPSKNASKGKTSSSKEHSGRMVDCAKICASLTGITTYLENLVASNSESDITKGSGQRISEATSAVSQCREFVSVGQDDEAPRTSAKVRRVLEKLRRVTVKLVDSPGSVAPRLDDQNRRAAVNLLVEIVAVLEHCLSQGFATTDILTPAFETLFTLARITFVLLDADTYSAAYDHLARAQRLLSHCRNSSLDGVTHANYVRCVSGVFYNMAGTLYQANRHSYAIRFLLQGCELGREALRLRREEKGGEGDGKQEEAWTQVEEQIGRRWELLGVCYSKISERKLASDAFVESIKAFSCSSTSFPQLARSGPSGSMFDATPTTKQLGTIIDRVTYMATRELFRPHAEVSLKHALFTCTNDRDVIGAVLERQIDSLESSRWKDDVRDVIKVLLADVLNMYEPKARPVRRARMLLRCLEAAYYEDRSERHPDEVVQEIEGLLSREEFDEDVGLVKFASQYLAMAKVWQALHKHRAGEPSGVPRLLEDACSLLKPLIMPVTHTSPRVSRSPVVVRKAVTVKGVKSSAKRGVGRRVVSKQEVVTPPRKLRRALENVSTNTIHTTPPRSSKVGGAVTVLENFDKFLGLLEMAAQLSSLLGHVQAKVRILNTMRRLAERYTAHSPDGYVKACVDLAHEYVKLGKIGKAGKIYAQALSLVRSQQTSEEAVILFLLRYAESLAISDNVLRSATSYCEAMGLQECLRSGEKGLSTYDRVKMRVSQLERAAIACSTFAAIQYAKDDPSTSIRGLLQALRLWNRALDSLARLQPPTVPPKLTSDDNPFDMTDVKEALPSVSDDEQKPAVPHRSHRDGLEWRIAHGILVTLFTLTQAYFARGSAREAQYFAEQALDLARSLNAPAAVGRALTKRGEIQLHLAHFTESFETLKEASNLLKDVLGPEAADIMRLRGDYHRLIEEPRSAQQLYDDATAILRQLETNFSRLDGLSAEARRSSISKSRPVAEELFSNEAIVPALAASVLRQQIWLLRNDGDERYEELLQRFLALPSSAETKAEEVALMARLTLHDVHNRFRGDLFLSSLAESAISIPMGSLSGKRLSLSPVAQDILSTLVNSEKMLWSDLSVVSRRGQVPNVRNAILTLVLVRTLQTSLSRAGPDECVVAAGLLDHASAVALRRELLETIDNKFIYSKHSNDLQWPVITPNGSPVNEPGPPKTPPRFTSLDFEMDELDSLDDPGLKSLWLSIEDRCRANKPDLESLSISRLDSLPPNWSIVNMSVTENKDMMLVSKRSPGRQPVLFCLPLRGRRDSEEEEHLSFDGALAELREIIRLSDEGTRQAAAIKRSQGKSARVTWWAERSALDRRLQDLLENIEFCWLGAFKTILAPELDITSEILASFRASLDKVFRHTLKLQDKKQKSLARLDDSILQCFCALSPQCRDEELEDLVYFVLDFYQLDGVQVATAEVDVDQVAVDLRLVLEEYSNKIRPVQNDEHMFLVLDRNVHEIPWESLPILRGRSVSRIPSSDFLLDRLDYVKWRRQTTEEAEIVDRVPMDLSKVYYVLNPSGDLKATEGRFRDWVTDMRKAGWDGIIGRQPSELEFTNALSNRDLVIYFGHGGGEQYVRSHKIRHLTRCAATMLWGCSSGALRDMGDFDPIGTPYNYMLAGCPTLVANLWDVTDRDIDKFSQAVFDELAMSLNGVKSRETDKRKRQEISVVQAVAKSRDVCKLKYLTGAAPVIYGIPFYL